MDYTSQCDEADDNTVQTTFIVVSEVSTPYMSNVSKIMNARGILGQTGLG